MEHSCANFSWSLAIPSQAASPERLVASHSGLSSPLLLALYPGAGEHRRPGQRHREAISQDFRTLVSSRTLRGLLSPQRLRLLPLESLVQPSATGPEPCHRLALLGSRIWKAQAHTGDTALIPIFHTGKLSLAKQHALQDRAAETQAHLPLSLTQHIRCPCPSNVPGTMPGHMGEKQGPMNHGFVLEEHMA